MHDPEQDPDASLPDPPPADPLPILERWFEDASARSGQQNPDAMALSTVDETGAPDARMVLCRGFDARRGALTFYTHRESDKGRQLAATPWAAAVFYWDALSRQVRLRGSVELASEADSDAYFRGRPERSRVAAWTSEQSRPIASRAALIERHAETEARLRAPQGPGLEARPPFWGGYVLVAESIELWVGRRGRLHDRIRWTRVVDGEGPRADVSVPTWRAERLQP